MSSKKPKTINPDEVDPSVYYYDEVYDEMKDEEGEKDKTKNDFDSKKPRTSKYIEGLQEMADLRKTEKELRKFNKYAKDRQEEKNSSSANNNDDVYITKGYKKKLEEMKLLEEDKRKRLIDEKDNTMNFLKKFKCDIKDSDILERKNSETSLGNSKNVTTQKSTDETLKNNDEATLTDGSQLIQPKKELKTLQERRRYLRKVLAKRTVGKVFEDAVKRYKERKALAKL